jgi:sulfate/thiosulfate transport system ATP-binding protein
MGEEKNGIEVIGVTKDFGDFRALDDVSVSVPDGSMTALLGPSGSGKSTLLRTIAGLETPKAGEVFISGEDQTGTPVRKRNVGFVFQHYAAFKHMTVFENVAFGLRVRKQPKARVNARVNELLELVQLGGLAKRFPSQLSGGQRQRMALARALAVEPKVLLLDEPFGALDAKVRKDLRTWLRRLHDEVHVTTIFVTHDQEEAMDIAEQIVVMNEGRIEQTGSATDLYDNPENDFVMGFVGEVNRINGLLVRPHDLEILPAANGETVEADIERIVRLGFSGRVEMHLSDDGEEVWAQLTRSEIEALNLEANQRVFVRPRADSVTRKDTGAIGSATDESPKPPSRRPTPSGSGLPV